MASAYLLPSSDDVTGNLLQLSANCTHTTGLLDPPSEPQLQSPSKPLLRLYHDSQNAPFAFVDY
jgi:hypothetical protein